MQSRTLFSAFFMILILVLLLCALNAGKRYKAIGIAVARLDVALVLPLLGNFLIVFFDSMYPTLVGYYLFAIGLNYAIFEFIKFTKVYCNGSGQSKKLSLKLGYLLLADGIQMLLNPFTGHAFTVEEIVMEEHAYFKLVPLAGQMIHRVVCYAVLFFLIVVYFQATKQASKIYRERYSVILVSLVAIVLWESFYVFTLTPIDSSIVGLGLFGILLYYFSIVYKPLRLLDRILSGVVSNGSDAVFVFSPKGRCIWTNKEGCYLVGVQEDDCDNAPELLEYLFGTKLRRGNWSEKHRSGEGDSIKYYLLENQEVGDADSSFSGYFLKVKDITSEELKHKQDIYEATHDKLTTLYTKDHLYKLIAAEVNNHRNVQYMVVLVNISNFSVLNDIYGSDFADYALKTLANQLSECIKGHGFCGRIGGGDFGMLLSREHFDQLDIENTIDSFVITNDSVDYPVNVQIGAYEIIGDEADVATMFARARLALSTLNNGFNKHIAFYDDDIRKDLLWNQEISAELTEAIENRDIRPYLQPIVDITGRIVGAEALVRWIHPKYGFLPPYKFIPYLEKNGLVAEVDKYMWRCACETLKEWQERGLDLFLSVNISPKDFYFIDVPKYIKELVNAYGIEAGRLRVEITETVMMNDAEKMIRVLRELRDGGFIVEMDDFGSGYSSLNMLKDMPVDVLKIDMKFLGKSEDDKKADTIVKNIINLSRELGITSLTEGVETINQYDGLSQMGCKLFQGYYFSKPIPIKDFENLVDRNKEAV